MREWLVKKIKQLEDSNNDIVVMSGEVVENSELVIYKKVLAKFDELN